MKNQINLILTLFFLIGATCSLAASDTTKVDLAKLGIVYIDDLKRTNFYATYKVERCDLIYDERRLPYVIGMRLYCADSIKYDIYFKKFKRKKKYEIYPSCDNLPRKLRKRKIAVMYRVTDIHWK